MKTIKHVWVFLCLLHAALLRCYGKNARGFDVGLSTVIGIGAGCLNAANVMAAVAASEFWLGLAARVGLVGAVALSAVAIFLVAVSLPHAIKQGVPPWMAFLVDLWRQAGLRGEAA